MANEADLKLIQIPEFPKTDTLVGSGPEYVVLTKADGVTYGMLSSDFKAFLGTVQVQVPKALAPTDPAPTLSGVYYPMVTQNEDGTPIVYENAGGISVNTAEDGEDYGKQVQIIFDGTDYSKIGIPLPQAEKNIPEWRPDDYEEKDQVIYSNNLWVVKDGSTALPEDIPSEDSEVWEPLVNIDVSLAGIDRPDIEGLTILDDNGNEVFHTNEFDYHRIEAVDIDRPDIDLAFVDENGDVIWESGNAAGSGGDVDPEQVKDIIKMSELNQAFWEPPIQEGYSLGTSSEPFWLTYPYWDTFDEVRVNQKTASGYDPYVTRELLGKSSKGNYDIYRYEFKPVNPTRKVIVFGGIHGGERISPMVLQRFFKALCEDWMHNPALMWARHNIHFVTIPLASPFGFHHRNRRVWETDPFPATWTKTGTVATITFNPSDFPVSNPNVSATNYFTADSGVAGKVWVSLINSQPGLPDNGYIIQTVVNGQTITVTAPAGGASSGTCEIFISADPNRGFDLPLAPWSDSEPSTTTLSPYTDPVSVAYDNKGTKPYALNETRFVAETYELHSDATFAVDMHNGASDYDTRYAGGQGLDPTGFMVNNSMHVGFTNEEMPIRTSINNVASQYGLQLHDMNSFTIEWGDHSPVTDEIATESQRWMSNFILICSRFYNKKINH